MTMEKSEHEYDDIINEPRPKSKTHRPMPPEKRSAQFAPFEALTGFDDMISESSKKDELK